MWTRKIAHFVGLLAVGVGNVAQLDLHQIGAAIGALCSGRMAKTKASYSLVYVSQTVAHIPYVNLP